MDELSFTQELAQKARNAQRVLAWSGTKKKNDFLEALAHGLRQKQGQILEANGKDLERAVEKGYQAAFLDRLTLSPEGIESLARGVEEVLRLPDPVGEMTGFHPRPSGIVVGQMRIPLGVVLMIYESRPGVTVDAAVLCIKAGNAVLLRGGSEALETNAALVAIVQEALISSGLPKDSALFVADPERKRLEALLTLSGLIDLVVPRGGKGLIEAVSQTSRIPVLKHLDGNCHVYVDDRADLDMALDIAINAKTERPGVCNAMETLLVARGVAPSFLPRAGQALLEKGVEIRGCPETLPLFPEARPASEKDWFEEYLDLILAVKIVSDLDEAIAHIHRYGSGHTDAIVTQDHGRAMRFLREVDSSSVMVNASTRFADGGEYGLGAEIGISTDKLHARGPVGLLGLTTLKYVVLGEGQVRQSKSSRR